MTRLDGIMHASARLAMISKAAQLFSSSDSDTFAQDPDAAFRERIVAAMRDLRARERHAKSPELRLGGAANDDGRASATLSA